MISDKLFEKLARGNLWDVVPTKLVLVMGVIFGAWFVVGILGWPTESKIEQAGFRGTGMATVYNEEEWAEKMATLDLIPEDEEPYTYEEGEEVVLAGDVYENVQVLGHVSEDNFLRLMTAITQWVSPDQGCAYCHGEDGNFASDEYYPKVVSRRMIQMTQNINGNWSDHVKQAGVNCYTCHRGMNVPQYIWFDQVPKEDGVLGWLNNQNQPNERVAYSDLPSNIFEKFLVENNEIRVINTSPYGDDNSQPIKATEWTFGLMTHMSKSLNVNCAYCHNTRSMNVWEQSPPQRLTAWYGIRMVRELNNEYLNPLQPVYPEFRLGPTGDAPKANCTTCHQGVYKPLFGENMIDNWPELSAPAPGPVMEEAPVEEPAAEAEEVTQLVPAD
jgi:photosynthetic reaction center cytochrome c subunit